MLRRLWPVAVIAFVIIGSAAAIAGPARIRIISIHQARAMEPATVTVFVSVPPAPENRGFWLVVDCRRDDGLSTRSFHQLEGDQEERAAQPPIELRLSGCLYGVQAILMGDRGELARSEVRAVRVLCRSCDDRDGDD